MEEWTIQETVEYDMEDKTHLFEISEYRNLQGKLVFSIIVNLQAPYLRATTEIYDETEYKRYQELSASGLIKLKELERQKIPF